MSENVQKLAVSNTNSYFTPRKAPDRGTIPNGISTTLSKLEHSPAASILAYCLSSISMTVVNKYVVSGVGWNLNFLYLAVQSVVCTLAVMACKKIGLLGNLAPFDMDKAKTCKIICSAYWEKYIDHLRRVPNFPSPGRHDLHLR